MEATITKPKTTYDYQADWNFVLHHVMYDSTKDTIAKVIEDYQKITQGDGAFFNYYRFGSFINQCRWQAKTKLDLGIMGKVLSAIERLENYILPTMFKQNHIFLPELLGTISKPNA